MKINTKDRMASRKLFNFFRTKQVIRGIRGEQLVKGLKLC